MAIMVSPKLSISCQLVVVISMGCTVEMKSDYLSGADGLSWGIYNKINLFLCIIAKIMKKIGRPQSAWIRGRDHTE